MRDEVITQDVPLPLPSVDNVEFYRAAQRGELSFQRCSDCRAWRHYPLPVCPDCASTSFAWERASGDMGRTPYLHRSRRGAPRPAEVPAH